MNPHDRPLPATLFSSLQTAYGKSIVRSLREFAEMVETSQAQEKETLQLISFCPFAGNHPSTRNALTFSAVALDYDAGRLTLDGAAQQFRKAGLSALLYSTPSSTRDAPRWRVVLPMSEDKPAALYSKMVARANGVVGGVLAPESFTAAQAYFFGHVGKNARCVTKLI